MDAAIANILQEKITIWPNDIRFKTTVLFSDGLRFVTYQTERKKWAEGYTVFVDGQRIIDCARKSHERAVKMEEDRVTVYLVNEQTGCQKSFDFSINRPWSHILETAIRDGFLAKSEYPTLCYHIRELKSDYLDLSRFIRETYYYHRDNISGLLCDGCTLHIYFDDTEMKRLKRSGALDYFYNEYEVVAEDSDEYLLAVCHGYNKKREVENMFPTYYTFYPNETSWPEYHYNSDGTKERIEYLCQLSKERRVFLSGIWIDENMW